MSVGRRSGVNCTRLKSRVEGAGQRLGQRGLAHARHVLHEHVPAGQEGGQEVADHLGLAQDDPPQLLLEVLQGLPRRGGHFLNAATNSFSIRGLLLLMAPSRKSLGPGVCFPLQTSRNICSEALKKQSASFSGLPALTSHLSEERATVHFSSSPREK